MFSVAGVGASLVGSKLNQRADQDVLLLAFAGLMLVAATAMWRSLRRRGDAGCPPPTGDAAAAPATTITVDALTVVKVIVAGSVVGALTGFFGVGGGFVIVPALVLALGFTMPHAIGTSLLVIVINSLVALSTRLHGGNIGWSVIAPFAIASLGGVIVGGRLAGTADPAKLQRWFIALLVAVAVYTATSSALALR